ncbi:LamG-like jellyroll fold domain-containing protein [Candidatus Albibeggiatoa sp. nov. BB20]|uniref:LamG-like jellyroll fold domain-containing protein n=1 Tax=Candidatus Albibeggiatoa sp. nov. BB20 TaxID=3162723 RepID=UPI0033659090
MFRNAKYQVCWYFIMFSVAVGVNANPHNAPFFLVINGDNQCPTGYVLATSDDVQHNQSLACSALGRWDIARIADNNSMKGIGHNCKIQAKANDVKKNILNYSLCKQGSTNFLKVKKAGLYRFTDYALEFDGNSYLEVDGNAYAEFDLENNFTIEAWVKPNALNGIQMIFSKISSSGNGGYGFGLNNSKLYFATYGVQNYETNPLKLSAENWNHVAVTLDEHNHAHFYLNGDFVQNIPGSKKAIIIEDKAQTLRVGSLGSGNGGNWTGLIDEVRIWNVARTESKIRHNMYGTLPSSQNLIARYSFNDYPIDMPTMPTMPTIPNSRDILKTPTVPKRVINSNNTKHYCDYMDKYLDILNHGKDSLSTMYSDLKMWRQAANILVNNKFMPDPSIALKMALTGVMKQARQDLYQWKLDLEDELYNCINYRALVIGISEYTDASETDLNKPAKEAQEIADLLQYDYGFKVKQLIDEKATKENIEEEYNKLLESSTERDLVLIYFTGHGGDNNKDSAYWLSTGGGHVKIRDLNEAMSKSQAKKVLIVADSCYFSAGKEPTCPANDRSCPVDNKVRVSSFANDHILDYQNIIIRKLRNQSHVIIASGNDEIVDDGVFGQAFINTLRSQLTSSERKNFGNYNMFTARKVYEHIEIAMNNARQNPKYIVRKNGDFIFRTIKSAQRGHW